MYLFRTFIYKVTAPDGKVYIGQTVDLKRRLSEYKRGSVGKQPALQKSLKNFGFETHEVEVLFSGPLTKKELNAMERAYIRKFDSENPDRGLNRTKHNRP